FELAISHERRWCSQLLGLSWQKGAKHQVIASPARRQNNNSKKQYTRGLSTAAVSTMQAPKSKTVRFGKHGPFIRSDTIRSGTWVRQPTNKKLEHVLASSKTLT